MIRPTARIASVLLLCFLSLGCASNVQTISPAQTPLSEPVVPSQTITLNLGQHITLNDKSSLRYTQLINDSRCAPTVQCIWAGDAEIELQWKAATGGQTKTFSLHTNPREGQANEMTLGTSIITLNTLARGIAPAATLSIRPTTP